MTPNYSSTIIQTSSSIKLTSRRLNLKRKSANISSILTFDLRVDEEIDDEDVIEDKPAWISKGKLYKQRYAT